MTYPWPYFVIMNTKPRSIIIFVFILSLIISACGPGQLSGPSPTATLTYHPFTELRDAYKQAKSIELAEAEYEEGGYPMTAVLDYHIDREIATLMIAAFVFVEPDGKVITVSLNSSGESQVLKAADPVTGFPSSISDPFTYMYINEQDVLKQGWDKLGAGIEANCGPITGLEVLLSASGEGFRTTASGLEVQEGVPAWQFTYNGKTSVIFSGYDFEVVNKDNPCN